MSDVSAVVKYFPTVNEGFTTTLGSGGVLSGGAVIPLTGTAGLTNGTVFIGIIEPGQTKQQVFTGTVDTTGSQITGVKWTRGTNVDHLAGVTIVDYVTGTAINMISTGIKKSLNDDGSLKNTAVRAALNLDAGTSTGWTVLGSAPNTVTYLGNHHYSVVFNSTDLTSTISPGMKLRATRNTASPTQSTSLNGTNQYWQKTTPNKMTWTDDFAVSAWIKLNSWPAAGNTMGIQSKTDSSSGWTFWVNEWGQVVLNGRNGGAPNYSRITSASSLPLNRWIHVAAQLDMSAFTVSQTTSYIMLDGVDSTAAIIRGGTNPTALVQVGNYEVGRVDVSNTYCFNGKIAQAAVFNSKVTQATMASYISQGLSGAESNLASAYSFNSSGNDLNTTTPNDLTAQGTATATNADSFAGTQANGTISNNIDYGVVETITFSTNTTMIVRVPEGNTFPTTGTISAMSYSTQYAPFGFPDADYISRFSRTVVNPQTVNLANADQDLRNNGLVVAMTSYGGTTINIRIDLGVSSTSDFEFRPEIYLNGALYQGFTPSAALTSAGNRAATRGFTSQLTLPDGVNYVSAGVTIISATGPGIAANAAFMTVTVAKGYGFGN